MVSHCSDQPFFSLSDDLFNKLLGISVTFGNDNNHNLEINPLLFDGDKYSHNLDVNMFYNNIRNVDTPKTQYTFF